MVTVSNETAAPMKRVRYFAPVVVLIALAGVLGWSLGHDPREIRSTLIGKPAPSFELPPVKGRQRGLSSRDLYGEVSLVNVFASWCAECRDEHPLLLKIKAGGVVTIHGIDYKDPPDDAARWLDAFGDPYTRTGADRNGRVGIDWGVYGVPETFVVGKDGRIAYRHIGLLTQEELDRIILPLVERLRQ